MSAAYRVRISEPQISPIAKRVRPTQGTVCLIRRCTWKGMGDLCPCSIPGCVPGTLLIGNVNCKLIKFLLSNPHHSSKARRNIAMGGYTVIFLACSWINGFVSCVHQLQGRAVAMGDLHTMRIRGDLGRWALKATACGPNKTQHFI